MALLNWYSSLSAAVMIMIGIFLVGLILARLKPMAALKAAIYVAGGIIGLNTMVGMFAGAAVPVISDIIQNMGLSLDIIDLGVGSSQSYVIFPLPFYSVLLLVGLLVNIAMILLNFTNTFDVDIFNYYVFALSSAYVYAETKNVALSIIAFVITEIIILKFADLTAPAIQKAYGLDGVSIPHGNAVVYAPVGMLVNWIIEKIPGLRDINWNPDTISEKFGGLVEPSFIGFVMGIVFGIKSLFAQCW